MTTTQLRVDDYLKTLAVLGYGDIRLNQAGAILEINGKPLDDFVLATICARMRAEGYTNRAAVEDVLKMAAAMHPFHPVKTYLGASALSYDGGDHIASLASYFTDATKPHAMFTTWLRKWLIGCCSKAMASSDRGEQNAMLVLDGDQGLGKSFFCQWLCSGLPQFFIEGPICTRSNDVWLRLGSFWIWEVSELSSTMRANDVEALKGFVTTRIVVARRPWGRLDMRCSALASMIGTVNNSAGFLADRTGSRRFLCATIDAIDWGYAQSVNVGQVWGEAMAAYARGESHYPTAQEMKLSSENNENYELPDPVDGYIERYFTFDDMLVWTSTADLVARLQDVGYHASSTRALAMDLAAAMKKRGVEKERRGSMGYLGVQCKYNRPADLADL